MEIWDHLKLQMRSGDVTTRLIMANVALFAVPFVLQGILGLFAIRFEFLHFVSLSSIPSELLQKPWSPITYAFFHAGFFHLLFNMVMLNFSGRVFLTFFTQKQMLGLYLGGALFAGAIYILSYLVFPALASHSATLVGASAAIMAVLFGVVGYAPHMNLRLLLIGNVKLWHIAAVLIILDLIQLQASNTGGHLSHLGGAFFGYLYAMQLKRGRDITLWIAVGIQQLQDLFSKKKKTPFKKVHRTPNRPQPSSKIVTKDREQQQIDEILDKISRSGYESLTKSEKEFLFRAGKK